MCLRKFLLERTTAIAFSKRWGYDRLRGLHCMEAEHTIPSFLAGNIRDGRFSGPKNYWPLGSWWEMPSSV